MTTPNGPDFKTLSPRAMAGLIGAQPHCTERPALDNRSRAALKYFLARALPAEHLLSDSAARNAAPVSGLWDAYHNVPACYDAWTADQWPAKPYTGPRRRGRGRYPQHQHTPQPPHLDADAPDQNQPNHQPNQPEPQSMPLINPTPDKADAARKLAEALALLTEGNQAPMDENRVREIAAEEAAKQSRVEYRERIIVQTPTERRQLPDQPRHKIFADILDVLDAGENLLLVGPAGSGKTHVAEQVAEALNLGFNFTGAVASEFKLTGYQDAQGVYRSTAFRRAYEQGGVFLWDEMDASSASAMLAFNAGLANEQQDFPDGAVRRHADFRAIASANTYGRGADRLYVGRNQMDAASLDRFVVLEMDYDEALERALYGDTPWTARVQSVRAAVAKLGVRHVVSMRATKAGKALLAKGWAQDKVESACLWRGLKADDIRKINAEAR